MELRKTLVEKVFPISSDRQDGEFLTPCLETLETRTLAIRYSLDSTVE
jgi:hypothetical protein